MHSVITSASCMDAHRGRSCQVLYVLHTVDMHDICGPVSTSVEEHSVEA
jgi:hypothetical protein